MQNGGDASWVLAVAYLYGFRRYHTLSAVLPSTDLGTEVTAECVRSNAFDSRTRSTRSPEKNNVSALAQTSAQWRHSSKCNTSSQISSEKTAELCGNAKIRGLFTSRSRIGAAQQPPTELLAQGEQEEIQLVVKILKFIKNFIASLVWIPSSSKRWFFAPPESLAGIDMYKLRSFL